MYVSLVDASILVLVVQNHDIYLFHRMATCETKFLMPICSVSSAPVVGSLSSEIVDTKSSWASGLGRPEHLVGLLK
jgi:hypothetical protein